MLAQEIEISKNLEDRSRGAGNAATRNVDLMAEELSVYGCVTPELWEMVLDEERTHAAEVLAAQEASYAAVPRTYYLEGDDLIDIHRQSLQATLRGGISYSLQELEQGIPGAEWELGRRRSEKDNLQKIIDMPIGSVCVEISAAPYDKPKKEQQAQHYTGLTMIRASFKDRADKITQYNYAVPLANPEFLQAVQAKLGRRTEEQLVASDELLKNPIIKKVDHPATFAAREIDGLIGAALLETSVGQSALRMIRRAIENRREAWQFVTSESNQDINLELRAAMIQAAAFEPVARQQAMNAVRSGFWKELKDRFNDNKIAIQGGGILMAAATRAVAAGDVFIACGSTVVAAELPNTNASPGIGRAEIVKNLRENVVGSGSCAACGIKGKLFGCGLCGGCNKKWCDIYATTGRQTNIKNLAYLRYGRSSRSIIDIISESFSEEWKRISNKLEEQRSKKLRPQLRSW